MANTWGRPPRNELGQDLQALALWILIIGVIGYVLFPDLFKNMYSHLSDPVAQTSDFNDQYTLNNNQPNNVFDTIPDNQTYLNQDYSSVSKSLYNNTTDEVSVGYWVIFVADGKFKQMPVTSDAYTYLMSLIEKDQNTAGEITIILSANGKISKFNVSEEVYAIITNMAVILNRIKP